MTQIKRLVAVIVIVLALTCLLTPVPLCATTGKRPLTLGVLAFRPKPDTRLIWNPLVNSLNRSLTGYEFTLEVLTYPEMEEAITQHRLDFVVTNPAHYIEIRYRHAMSGVLATLVEQYEQKPLDAFGGAIIVKSTRNDLERLTDLAGKTIAAVGISSLGGYQAQAYELARAGVKRPVEKRLVTTGMPHDLVVQAVLDGKADAGFVRSGVIEQMAHEGRLKLPELKIINRQTLPFFPFAVSTHLYPEWPVKALAHVEEGLARQVAATLLQMEYRPNTKGMSFQVFTIPADYAPVETLLRELRLPPFDEAPAFTIRDIWQRYHWQFMILLAAAAVIACLALFLITTNRRLTRVRKEAETSAATLRTILNTLTIGVSYLKDRRVVFANPAHDRIFGYATGETAGMSTRAFYSSSDGYERIGTEGYAALAQGKAYATEEQMQRKDGALIWCSLAGQPINPTDPDAGTIWITDDITERKQYAAEREKLIEELQEALINVRQLSGFLPICASCKKIRNDEGYWEQVDEYIRAHSEAQFSHSICPECTVKLYGDL